MARYIDAETLKKNIRVNLMPNVDVDGTVTVENAERYFLNLIEKTTTADVEEVPKWIDVNERLPDEDTRVLVCIEEIPMAYLKIDTDRMVKGKWVRWRSFVTHWMPLPEPPSGAKMDGGKEE